MLTRTGLTTNAHRKGGPRSRSHNDDRFKGTLTGVAIPEAPRGSDGIEDFENLLESAYDSNKPASQVRNIRHKSPNGVSRNGNLLSEKGHNDDSERSGARSKPPSAIAPSTSRSIRSMEREYGPVPSPRTNTGRSAVAQSPAQRRHSPAYDPLTALPFPAPRPPQTFGELSRYHEEQPDADAVMDQWFDYNGGALVDQDSSSPPPAQTSSPPQSSKKVVHSPLAARTTKKSVDTADEDDELGGSIPRQVKGKQRATEEPADRSPLVLPRKSHGKSRLDLVQDEAEEVTPVRKGRSSGDMGPPPSKSSLKNRTSQYPEPEDVPADDQYDDPLLGNDNRDDYDDEPLGMVISPHEEEQPPRSATEHSDAESEEQPRAKSKGKGKQKKEAPKSKEKAPDSKKKKRPRDEEDDEPPRQKKKPKSTDSRATARGRSKTPDPDRSYLEELVSPSEDENEDDDGVRRSRRAKIAPVKFWLGEKLEYETYQPGTNRQVPTILGVRRVPEVPAASLSRRKKKGQTKGRSKSRKFESEEPESRAVSVVRDDSGWDDDTEPIVKVLEYESNNEVEKLIAFTKSMVVPKMTEKGHFLYQRIFADEKFVAAGQVVIPPKGEKPKKSAKDNTYVFYLIEGVVHVIVHETKFYLSPGGMFMVPRGNHYYIRNMKDYDAKLFFVQGRLMTADDFEGSRAGTARPERSPSRARNFDDSGGGRRISSSKGDARPKATPRNSKRPKLNTGGTESNLNDLVNFHLPPRRQHFTGSRRSKKTGASSPWAKERFINSAYRFVLKPSVTADYTVHFVDPDIYFQWPDIAQILVPHTGSSVTGEGNTMCPICLGAPIAPRMTKCGHVYCYSCVLHYLEMSRDHSRQRCPICFDSISHLSLKPVKWSYGAENESQDSANLSSTLKMRLMQRPQLTTLALPLSETWPSELIPPHQAAFQFLPDIYTFAKFMLPTPQSLQKDFQDEIDALKVDKEDKIIYGDDLGATFVEAAIVNILDLVEEAKALDVRELRDAVTSATRGMEMAKQRASLAKVPEFSPASFAEGKPEEWGDEHDSNDHSSRESSGTPTRQHKSRKNVNPPPPSTSSYYFYQAASGSLVFLHPLDIRILLSHFGSYANFPRSIEVKVEARNEGTVDEDLRKRCRYLAHLPEAADVTFVEADLESVVGKESISPFDAALKSRRSRRIKKDKKDDRAKLRAEEKEKEKLAEEHWILQQSAQRQTTSAQREEDELRAFLQADNVDSTIQGQGDAQAQQAIPGAWGERSFASTLSGPATGRVRTETSPLGHADQWDIDNAWRELEQARSAAGGGRKKKAPKLVLSLNGGGAPTGRRR